ncbi:hypothetical protein GGS23DRAFT_45965 [Durotheca rogersii]|uniref:uncharacterized protein n=1 Tax=Durotheca rogersii TaxID=419775 RepID=UPI00221FDAF7|nr:uncharacterized protein GGS23DRAFT_45965 [Durotheca rogersii]KAI5868689.1 hypothetical protein GGS23DRAFT_45965 [Durotheca rogersii]
MYRGRTPGPSRGLSSGRARARGSSAGRARAAAWRRRRDRVPEQPAPELPFGRLVTKIELDRISGGSIPVEDAKITDCRYAASYSLVDSKPPVIIIPVWSPPPLPSQLAGDNGEYLRDHNGARFPEHPMLPTVQSIFSLDKRFDPSSVDIVGCASALGDILRFVRSVESTFRFDVEMIENTLFLETKSHQRIISYSFGGLQCLVRFECDAHSMSAPGDVATIANRPEGPDVAVPPIPNSVAVKVAGTVVPQESVIEIKTKSQAGRPVEMEEHLPRLWIRQIPNLVAAYHDRGNFEEVQMNVIRQDILDWETSHELELRKFASVLHQLIIEVQREGHLNLELCRTGTGPLELREQHGKAREALPGDWKDRWSGNLYQEQQSDEGPLRDSNSDDDYPHPAKSYESDDSDDSFTRDYTACSLECGYCGRCEY